MGAAHDGGAHQVARIALDRRRSRPDVTTAILIVFALTYAGISARRLRLLPIGRPAVALVGAALMVALGTFAGEQGLSIDAALRAIEPHTIALLLGMMVVAAALDVAGFFHLGANALARAGLTPKALLWSVTLLAGICSALLVNDAVCLLATPMVVSLVRRTQLPLRPFLFALCMGSNAGSAMTLSGNPQNMLVAQLSGISYRGYLASAAMPGLCALIATAAVLSVLFGRELAHRPVKADVVKAATVTVQVDRWLLWIGLATLLALVVANLAGVPLALGAMLAASVCLIAARSRAEVLLARVDWSVLLFFAALFVLVAALQKTGAPAGVDDSDRGVFGRTAHRGVGGYAGGRFSDRLERTAHPAARADDSRRQR
jgi:Na+/H+ antiporter NhaD/arsenite permease-like protein